VPVTKELALNYVAGRLSDRSGKRKIFAIAGYGFSTLAKTILLVSTSIVGLSIFRVIERLGKGFRGPPRDAWLSALADPATRGYSFGVHKAFDKAGAVFGQLVAYGLLRFLGESAEAYRTLFWIAFVPAVLSIIVLSRMTDQPGKPQARESISANWKALSPGFKRFLFPAGVFALGDVTGRSHIVVLGYLLYGAINLALIWAIESWQIIALFALYGVFFAVEESQSKAFIADLEPERRATAIGMYNFVTGVLYLPASLIAGALFTVDSKWAFMLATALSVASILSFIWLRPASTATPLK
jgi:MFS family permease